MAHRSAGANLLADVPARLEAEQVSELLARPGLRIERIVSTGQASPPGFWYDQAEDEFVLVMQGRARLRLDGEAAAREMAAGDWAYLPAHRRHRVDSTSTEPPTVWLAVHVQAPA